MRTYAPADAATNSARAKTWEKLAQRTYTINSLAYMLKPKQYLSALMLQQDDAQLLRRRRTIIAFECREVLVCFLLNTVLRPKFSNYSIRFTTLKIFKLDHIN